MTTGVERLLANEFIGGVLLVMPPGKPIRYDVMHYGSRKTGWIYDNARIDGHRVASTPRERDIQRMTSSDSTYAIVVRHELRGETLMTPRIIAVCVLPTCDVDKVLAAIDDIYTG